jgi:hypothetical protein
MNDFIISVFENQPLIASVFAWFAAQTVKAINLAIRNKKFRIDLYALPGGFPSSHSATSVALATSLGLLYGFDSPFFGIAAIFAFFIIYDARVIRMAAGKQAHSLNRLIEYVVSEEGEDELGDIEKAKEVLGHSIFEIFIGGLIGILSALLIVYGFK